MYDIKSSEVVQSIQAHDNAIWSLDWHEKPAGYNGITVITGSSDQTIKLWGVLHDKEKNSLKLKQIKKIDMPEAVQWVSYAYNGEYYAAALLNNSINIYFSDSDKEFLSLYGHKLPVMCFDISSDNTLLVSASADKNVKIWGLDFGNCQKSIWAHSESITQVKFIKDTHYFITASKDKKVKYWDADKFILVMEFEEHQAEIWCLAVSSIGDFFVTGGNDIGMRAYLQSKEQVFANVEEDARQEKAIVEKYFEDSQKYQNQTVFDADANNGEEVKGLTKPQNILDNSLLTKRSFESLKYGEEMIEAINAAEEMRDEYQQYEEKMEHWRKSNKKSNEPEKPDLWKLRGAKSIPEFVLDIISKTKPTELYASLKFMHFTHCEKMLLYIRYCLENNIRIELCTRVLFILVDLWKNNILNSKRLI